MRHSVLFVNRSINYTASMPLFRQIVKQVPLLFAVMSGKRACDYRAIYTWIQDNVPDLQVKLITSDFELALWRACTQFLETVSKFVAVCFTGSKQCSEKSKSSFY